MSRATTVRWMILWTALALFVAGCGGNNNVQPEPGAAGTDAETQTGAAASDSGSDEATTGGEPVGPAETNTFVVGSEVWVRQLPMTVGQCFLPAEDGSDPVNGTAWGPMEAAGIEFFVDYNAGGAHEAQVQGADFWWAAGSRVGTQDLVVEVDHDNMTISGQGTFSNLQTGQTAQGSFNIRCEPDG